jgi:hypothetical protein
MIIQRNLLKPPDDTPLPLSILAYLGARILLIALHISGKYHFWRDKRRGEI